MLLRFGPLLDKGDNIASPTFKAKQRLSTRGSDTYCPSIPLRTVAIHEAVSWETIFSMARMCMFVTNTERCLSCQTDRIAILGSWVVVELLCMRVICAWIRE